MKISLRFISARIAGITIGAISILGLCYLTCARANHFWPFGYSAVSPMHDKPLYSLAEEGNERFSENC